MNLTYLNLLNSTWINLQSFLKTFWRGTYFSLLRIPKWASKIPKGRPRTCQKITQEPPKAIAQTAKKNVYAVDVSNPSKTIPKESPNKPPKSSRDTQERAEKHPASHRKPLPRQQIKRLRRRRFETIHNDAQGVPKQPPKSPWLAQERAKKLSPQDPKNDYFNFART